MKNVKIVLLACLIVLPVIFVVSNLAALSHTESLRLSLIFASIEGPPIPVGFMLLVAFAVGFAAAYLLGMIERRRLKKDVKGLMRLRHRAEEELNNLRNLPITGKTPTADESIGYRGETRINGSAG
jgi:hypothetical protein